jgi:hypothetical protein
MARRQLGAGLDRCSAYRWQLTLDDERYIWDVRLLELAGDTPVVRQSDSLVHAPIAHIREMHVLRQTTLRVGDGHESAISALAGTVGVYDLALLDVAERRSAIESILSQRPKAD